MLILEREPQESITIYTDPPIKILLINISGNRAKLGIDAPKNILILRDEVEYRPREDDR